MAEENTETQVSDNDIKAMQAALKKANGEAAHYRTERNTLRERYVKLAAERTLSEAGLTNSKASKFIDFSKVTVTDTGELEGLTEQLETLREDLPELFGAGDKKVSGGADAANKKEARPQKSSADIIAERLMNS
ncbi:scaffolding protein [Streptomyces phage Mulchroom]|nr:scaffolding protein [Streptomyces phage Mulchroom]